MDFFEFQRGDVFIKGLEHPGEEMLDKKCLAVNNNLVIINVWLVVFSRYFEEEIIGVFGVFGVIILVVGGLCSDVGADLFDGSELKGEGGVEEVAVDEEVEDFEVVLVE